jgi:hypothetical protein
MDVATRAVIDVIDVIDVIEVIEVIEVILYGGIVAVIGFGLTAPSLDGRPPSRDGA